MNNSDVSPGKFVNLWETLVVHEKNQKYSGIDGAAPVRVYWKSCSAGLTCERYFHKSSVSGCAQQIYKSAGYRLYGSEVVVYQGR